MVTCDECQINPIKGLRYKCSYCEDYDLCRNCYKKDGHKHPFIKFKEP